MDELWRLLALVNITLLLGLGFYLHVGHKAVLPPSLYRAGWAYGLVLGLVALAVFINYVSDEDVTVGLVLLAVVTTPSAVYVGWEVSRIVRDR